MAIGRRSTAREIDEFLCRRRRALRAADVGLVPRRSGDAGLTQADVAELAGISRQWYVRLEAGAIATPGLALLRRIAAALLLDGSASRRLFDLALAASVPTLARLAHDPRYDVLATIGVVRELARDCASASDVAAVAECAARALCDALGADFWYSGSRDGTAIVCRAASGPGEVLVGQREEPTNELAKRGFAGEIVACESVARSGVPVYLASGRLSGTAAFVGVPLMIDDAIEGLYGASFRSEREITAVELALAETIRSVAALALR